MKRFAYVCADPGIPVPGSKGSSAHVASVCRELERAGLSGEVYAARAGGDSLGRLPVVPVPVADPRNGDGPGEREIRLFLGRPSELLASQEPYDFVYERYSLWHVRGLARARELKVPFVLEVNSPLPDEARRFRRLRHEPLAEEIAGVLLREADGVVCVSQSVADWATRRRGRSDGVWVVPNGVDPERFSSGDRHRPPPLPPREVPLVAFCGGFRPWHATDDLLTAFHGLVRSRVPDAHLVCVGDGPTRAAFEERARSLGLAERIHVTGIVPQAEVAAWLAGADVAVAPYGESDDFYFSPLKLYEFLSLGLPVVAADIGQISEVVPHGRRGLLYPPGRVDALTDAMASLFDDRSEAGRLGQAGRSWVLEHATWAHRVAQILDEIRALGAAR